MFIYSIRASTVRLLGFVMLAVVLAVGLVLSGGGNSVSAMSSVTEIDYSGIKTKDDRIAFIEQFGFKVDSESEQEQAFRMPENFDRVILGYNELQKKQGLDLSKYRNKKVTRYTYKLSNTDLGEDVYANLFIHRGKVVACDITSAELDGFVLPLTLANK